MSDTCEFTNDSSQDDYPAATTATFDGGLVDGETRMQQRDNSVSTVRSDSRLAAHHVRTAENSARFRRVNEQIAEHAERERCGRGTQHRFVCECAVSECTDEIDLTLDEYHGVRDDPAHFVVHPHHVMSAFDDVVAEHERYWIIAKCASGRAAAEHAPSGPVDQDELDGITQLERAVDDARWQRAEYQESLRDYEQLVRHRIANPVTAICGLVQTMLDMPDMDGSTRHSVLRAMHDACHALRGLSFDPRGISSEEQELHARPFQGSRDRPGH